MENSLQTEVTNENPRIVINENQPIAINGKKKLEFNAVTGHLVNCGWKLNPNHRKNLDDPRHECIVEINDVNGKKRCESSIVRHFCLDGTYGMCSFHYEQHCMNNPTWAHNLSPCRNIALDENNISKEERYLINQYNCEKYGIPPEIKYNHFSRKCRKDGTKAYQKKKNEKEKKSVTKKRKNEDNDSNLVRKINKTKENEKVYDENVIRELTAGLYCQQCGFEFKRTEIKCICCGAVRPI